MFRKTRKYIVILLLLLSSEVFCLNENFSNPTTTPPNTAPPNLSESDNNATNPQIATSGNYAYAVWEKNGYIQVAISADAGINWTSPTSTPTTSPNLFENNASKPQITTDSSGRYVYAICQNFVSSNMRIQVAISSDFGENWTNPTSTPTGSPPNLSESGKDATIPQISTDSSGRYVYAIWQREDDSTNNNTIQVAISSDFGANWINPSSTPSNTTPPDLSNPSQASIKAQIATDSSGKYIYAIWQRNGIIQVVISSSFGEIWTDPTSTPQGTPPDLSGSGASDPQITTDSSGKYVYATWKRNGIIQVAISSDFGVNWTNPTSTTGSATPDLSDFNHVADVPQIVTDSSGKFVYAIWQTFYDATNFCRVAISSDFGTNWTYPTSVPTSIFPNLSALQNAYLPQIATDSSGRYVYATWYGSKGGNNVAQVVISSDFGINWTNPTSTPTGSLPDLSDSGNNARFPQIVTDATGAFIYVVWRWDSANYVIQVANGIKTFYPIKNVNLSK